MKVMADTNVIISALLFPASLPAEVLLHIADNHDLVLCDHIVTAVRDVISLKRPDLLGDVDHLGKRFSGYPKVPGKSGNSEFKRLPIQTANNNTPWMSGATGFFGRSSMVPKKFLAPCGQNL